MPTLPATIASAEENEEANTFSKGNKNNIAIMLTIIMIIVSNTLSPFVLVIFIFKTPFYHNELSETLRDTKFARHNMIIFTTELNNPIAVAYENCPIPEEPFGKEIL